MVVDIDYWALTYCEFLNMWKMRYCRLFAVSVKVDGMWHDALRAGVSPEGQELRYIHVTQKDQQNLVEWRRKIDSVTMLLRD